VDFYLLMSRFKLPATSSPIHGTYNIKWKLQYIKCLYWLNLHHTVGILTLDPTNCLVYCVCCWAGGAAGIRLENNTALRGPIRGNKPEYQFKNISLGPEIMALSVRTNQDLRFRYEIEDFSFLRSDILQFILKFLIFSEVDSKNWPFWVFWVTNRLPIQRKCESGFHNVCTPSLCCDLDFTSEPRAIQLGQWSGKTVEHFRTI